MTSRRPPASPPELPGYAHQRLLGSGGFSDVFLYRQAMPRRKVAVKVLRASPDDEQVEFVDEANLMAQVSSHPAIVTVYHADVAADGRPFLVMEYCAGPNLSEQYRSERLGVAEALRIGVRLAGAVETAHRAGILHRDIKPANVLTNDYGWPALTDFGISVVGAGASEIETGMSIPWAAPEFFADDTPRGVTADIYSLAATLYTVLAGRSPFEVIGGSNAAFDLISRITREPLPPVGRQDVPASLEQVLARAMDKRPGRRYPSALDLGRALQRVELELHLAPTPIDVPDVRQRPESEGSGAVFGETQVRPVIDIEPEPSRGWSPGQPFPRPPRPSGATSNGSPAVAGYPGTGATRSTRIPPRPDRVAAAQAATAPPSPGSAQAHPEPGRAPWSPPSGARPAALAAPWEAPREREVDPHAAPTPARRPWLGVVIAVAVVLVAVVTIVLLNLGGDDDASTPQTPSTGTSEPPVDSGNLAYVPPPENVTAERADDPTVVIVTWDAPADVENATFVYRVVGGDSGTLPAVSPLQIVEAEPGLCVEISTRNDRAQLSAPMKACG